MIWTPCSELAELTALLVQGAGPHFCPGGNPELTIRPKSTQFTLTPFAGFIGEMRVRELQGPLAGAVHGLVLGGGIAFALNLEVLVAESA